MSGTHERQNVFGPPHATGASPGSRVPLYVQATAPFAISMPRICPVTLVVSGVGEKSIAISPNTEGGNGSPGVMPDAEYGRCQTTVSVAGSIASVEANAVPSR